MRSRRLARSRASSPTSTAGAAVPISAISDALIASPPSDPSGSFGNEALCPISIDRGEYPHQLRSAAHGCGVSPPLWMVKKVQHWANSGGYRRRAVSRTLSDGATDGRQTRSARRGGCLASVERHADQRHAAEDQIDADHEPDHPSGGAGKQDKDGGGQDQVDNAACQHPTPSPGELALVIEREHDRGDALDDEKRDQDQRQGHGPGRRP